MRISGAATRKRWFDRLDSKDYSLLRNCFTVFDRLQCKFSITLSVSSLTSVAIRSISTSARSRSSCAIFENYTCSAINSRKYDLISNASPSIDRKVFAARIIIFWNNARKSDPFVNQCELKIIETIEKINPRKLTSLTRDDDFGLNMNSTNGTEDRAKPKHHEWDS